MKFVLPRSTISLIFSYLCDFSDIVNLMSTCKLFNKIGYQFFIPHKLDKMLQRLDNLETKMNRCDKIFVKHNTNRCEIC
jgi:hypothetical protein